MAFNFKKWNNILGLVVFIIASFVYLSTIERHLSFWDCGEYIVSSTKLGITHAPGAALFQLIGAVWAILTFGDGSKYAIYINAESAICSALTIMFLFWTITHFAIKLFNNNTANDKSENFATKISTLKKSQALMVLGSGLVGAFVFMFSDTFWFSSEEGEVYAMASMFTALVIWLGCKWENESDDSRANRWLILISLVIGLSTGVHLMVILALPMVCYMYYARKYKVTIKNFIIANIIIVAILGFVFKFLFEFVMMFFGGTEIFLVNNFGLPFNSGTLVAGIILIGIFVAALHYTQKFNYKILNTAVLSIAFMLIGFACWLVIPIRANANPHMNLNDPDSALGMKDYYNRVQYGDWPVMYGETYVANVASDGLKVGPDGNYVQTITGENYVRDLTTKKYKKVSDRKDYQYNDKYVKVFPKMYNADPNVMENYAGMYGFPEFSLNIAALNDPNYSAEENAQLKAQAEKIYSELVRKKQNGSIKVADLKKYNEILNIEPPTLWQEIEYFVDFQVGYMFLRYFMWNFSGKQNDWEGHREVTKGNWISGINAFDNARLGDQTTIPAEYGSDNMGHNVYFMLPFILGLIGFFFQLNRNFSYWWAILSLFFLTSIGIIIYTSVKPFEPRERDYALVSSFYAFAIWIGLGVQGLYILFEKIKKKVLSPAYAIGITVVTLFIPILMGAQNWDDHDRTYREVAYSIAHNYLNGLDDKSILFVYGDNDTYPLWGLQETENFRDDVKIVNYTLAGSSWNIEQSYRKTYNAPALPHQMTGSQYQLGTNDNIVVVGNKLRDMKTQLEDLFKKQGDAPINLEKVMQLPANEMAKYFVSPDIDPQQVISYYENIKPLEKYLTKDSMTAKEAMDFILKNSPEKKAIADLFGYPLGQVNFIPVNKITIPVNKANALKYGIVSKENADKMVDHLTINLQKTLYKNDLMLLDMFANYNWDRAIYFSGGGVSDPNSIFNTSDYLEYNGLTYKLIPVYQKFGKGGQIASSNTKALLKNYNQFLWGGYNNPKASFTETDRNYTASFRNIAVRLAEDLIKEGKKDEAKKVLDTVMEKIPAWPQYGVGYGISRIASLYMQIGETQKANKLFQDAKNYVQKKITYYNSLSKGERYTCSNDIDEANSDISMIMYNEISAYAKNGDKAKAMALFHKSYDPLKKELVNEINKYKGKGQNADDEVILNKLQGKFQDINELLSMVTEIDSVFARKESREVYQLLGEEDTIE